ncbi:AraC family transcriptional regulator [Paenibacillus sp. 5J-6]|jgi:AraC family transcriptional regulator of arabinose operon|uniref:AraC family transcriptional regulator n=1 Tax=Paenibacillus silvestris TaxID=2606219 RepID=A0A6L8UV75_9BACL|nr:AraC family transcriptional regulator [Paenibacillus silvestris]MZQ82123.1 AraC family transcriptional regulator [Paenibacillus silvestris]
MKNGMNASERTFWKKYLAKAKLDLSYAAYTKVQKSWTDENPVCAFNRLYFIREGEGYVRIGDQTYYPKPGDLYLLPAGSDQAYGTISDNTFGKYWCHFSAKIGDLDLFQILQTSPCLKVQNPEELVTAFEQLIAYSQSESLTSEFRAYSILMTFIADFIEQNQSVKLNLTSTPTFEKMNKVLIYMEQHIADNVSVDTLSRIAHYHPNYFINAFKQFTGYSPIQYMNHLRSEKAKDLLMTTELNVSQIADALGMELSYFSRMFREQTGFKPTAFRDLRPKTIDNSE